MGAKKKKNTPKKPGNKSDHLEPFPPFLPGCPLSWRPPLPYGGRTTCFHSNYRFKYLQLPVNFAPAFDVWRPLLSDVGLFLEKDFSSRRSDFSPRMVEGGRERWRRGEEGRERERRERRMLQGEGMGKGSLIASRLTKDLPRHTT